MKRPPKSKSAVPDGYVDVLTVTEPVPEVADLEDSKALVRRLLRVAQATAIAIRAMMDIDNEASPSEVDETQDALHTKLRDAYSEVWTQIGEEALLKYLTLAIVEGD
jgi:hypothetical protein